MPEPRSDDNGRPTPRSSDRVLALLAAVVDGDGELTLTELSDAVDLAPSTATRQLASLEAAGMVERGATGYRPGPTMVRLAHRVVAESPLSKLAQPILDDLAVTTGESAHLAVAHDAATATYLAAAEGTHHLRHAAWQGRQVPRAGTAVGSALDGTAAVGHDTVEVGVTGVSAPVLGTDGAVVAAVSVIGPTFRLRGTARDDARAAVQGAADRLTALLGG